MENKKRVALSEIPEEFLEMNIKEQETFLKERFEKVGKLHKHYHRLLGIVRGGTRLTENDFKKQ